MSDARTHPKPTPTRSTISRDDKGPRPYPQDFIHIEKNLAALGFFTPSSKRIKGSKKKTILFSKEINGKKVEVRANILPSAEYGLPITADQDKYLALMKIISDARQLQSEVKNPIGFTSADLLRILGLRVTAGKNYEDVLEWGKRMTLTGIISEGVVYFAGKRTWASDTFHVFERFVSVGKEMPDGSVADRNYLWLSAWQLENINNNHLLPIDFDTYRKLRNHIAKALVPLLQIWLYASRVTGYFEKRYEDLCQILNIRQYTQLSRIKEKLAPALDELRTHGYLTQWQLEQTSSGNNYKIIFQHGEKFHRDQNQRQAQRIQIPPPCQSRTNPDGNALLGTPIDPELFNHLLRRGIREKMARHLLTHLAEDQQVLDQLEWGEHLLRNAKLNAFYNPTGLYIHLIRENVIPPDQFETSRQRQLREAARQARETRELEQARQELAYGEYRRQAVEHFIGINYTSQEFSGMVRKKRDELLQMAYWRRIYSLHKDSFDSVAERQLKADLACRIGILSFVEFQKQNSSLPGTGAPSSLEDSGSVPTQSSVETRLIKHLKI